MLEKKYNLSEKLSFYKYAFILYSINLFFSQLAYTNPEGGVVSYGDATINSQANYTEIVQATDRAVIDWRSFNIEANQHTNFNQPSDNSITLNRVHSNEASNINGRLTANGNLIIVNQNGIMFGKESRVDVNGLLATTSDITNEKFIQQELLREKALVFDQKGLPDTSIVNEGHIVASNGLVGLVAPNVLNSGVIVAKTGKIELSSADYFTVDLYGDGLFDIAISEEVKSQLLVNKGAIIADGNQIILTAAGGKELVNSLIVNTGILSAKSVEKKNGKIIIYAEGSNAVRKNQQVQKDDINKGDININYSNQEKQDGYSKVLISGLIDVSGLEVGESGGKVQIIGDEVALLDGALINASGHSGKSGTTLDLNVSDKRYNSAGGEILIGGDYLGKGDLPTAKNLYVAADVIILNDAIEHGDAGRTIFWSDDSTRFYGKVFARALGGQGCNEDNGQAIVGGNLGDGGFVETSGGKDLDVGGYVDLTASNGERGTYFLDPSTINIYGNVNPAFVSTDGSINLNNNLKVWLDFSDQSKINLSYHNVRDTSNNLLTLTATGNNGSNNLSVSSAACLEVGTRIRLGVIGEALASNVDASGSDIYTITAIDSVNNIISVTPALAKSYSNVNLYQGYIKQITGKAINVNGYGSITTDASPTNTAPLWLDKIKNNLGVVAFKRTVENLNIISTTSGDTGDYIKNQTNFLLLLAYNLDYKSYLDTAGIGAEIVWGAFGGVSSFLFRPNLYWYFSFPGWQPTNNPGKFLNYNDHIVSIQNNNYTIGTYNNGTLVNPGLSSINKNFKDALVSNFIIGSSTASMHGRFYEIIEYDATIADSNRSLIEQYQSAKWGVSLLTLPSLSLVMAPNSSNAISSLTTNYLSKLSNTSNIIITADNVNLDFKGDTLNLANNANLSITTGTLKVLSSGIINTANLSGTSGNISITSTFSSLDLSNLILNANNYGNITITAPNNITLGTMSANKIKVSNNGFYSDLTIPSGKQIIATGTGIALTIATRKFINNEGNQPFQITNPQGRWLVYSMSPSKNVNADRTTLNNYTYTETFNYPYNSSSEPSGTDNMMLYVAGQPNGNNLTVNITATNGFSNNIIYGNQVLNLYTVSGYIGNDQSNDSISGIPYTINGYALGNSVGTYAVSVVPNLDNIVSGLGYGFVLADGTPSSIAGTFTVGKQSITITPAAGQSKLYNQSDPVFTYNITSGSLYRNDVLGNLLSRISGESINTYNFTRSTDIGNSSYNITLDSNTTNKFQINQLLLYPVITSLTKGYDNSTAATLTASNYVLGTYMDQGNSAIKGGDTVNLVFTSNYYDNVNVGNTKLVTAEGLSLSGSSAANYAIDNNNLPLNSANNKRYTSSNIGVINTKSVTVSATGTINKVYDGVVSVASNIVLQGITFIINPNNVTGDLISVSSVTGNLDSATAGSSKTLTITGITLSSANYKNTTSSISVPNCVISKVPITVNLINNITKTYDGIVNASNIVSTNYSVSGVVSVDNNTTKFNFINPPTTGTYQDAQADSNKIVTVTLNTGTNFSGTSLSNYTLPTSATGTVGVINKLGLTVGLVNGSMNKVYDSNANVTLDASNTLLAGTYTLSPAIISGDVVKIVATQANFNNANVSLANNVSVSGLSILSGQTGSGNYNILNAGNTLTAIASIVPKALVINTNSDVVKTYDGSVNANLSNVLFSIDPSSISGTDQVSLSSATSTNNGTYDSKSANAINGILLQGAIKKTITIPNASLTLIGTNSSNYILPTTFNSGIINQALITANFKTTPSNLITKIYDGANNATLNDTYYDLIGVIASENLTLSANSGVYDVKDIGDAKTVTFTGLQMVAGGNTSVSNYQLGNTTFSANIGQITPKSLTASLKNTSVVTKAYDQTTNATLTDQNYDNLTGVIINDTVTLNKQYTGYYNDVNVGINKTIMVTGLTLSGSSASNYTINSSASSNIGKITAVPLTINLKGTVTKDYDQTTNATLTDENYDSLTGIIANDIVTLNKQYSGHYNDPNIGNKTITITGLTLGGQDASNYSVNSSVTGEIGTITAKELTIASNDKVTKAYDGTRDAPSTILAGLNFNISGGVVAGDTVSISSSSSKPSSGTFDDATVSSNRTVTITAANSGIILDNNNYQIPPMVTVANCVINKKPITITLKDNITKTYDGTLNASNIVSDNYAIGGVVPIDFNNTDNFNFINPPTSGIYSDLNAGTFKTVTVTLAGNNFTGNNINNYTLPTSATGNGVINELGLTLNLVNNSMDKIYDGSINLILSENNILPTGTYTLDKSIINGDIVKIVATTAEFNNANVLLANSVNVSGLSILSTEPGANNYTIVNANSNLTAGGHISTKELTVTTSGDVVKSYDATTHANHANFSQVIFRLDPASVCTNASNSKDDVSVVLSSSSSGGEYDSQNANAIDSVLLSEFSKKTVTLNTDSNLNLTGNSKDNYHLPATLLINSGIVNKIPLTAELNPNVLVTKIYDGNTTATLTSLNYNLSGTIISNEEVILNTPSNGIYDNKQVVNNKTVTVTGLTISGRDVQNYILTNNVASALIGEINKKQLTAELIGEVKKKYDGNTNATLGIYNYNLKDAVVDDDVALNNPTTGVYDDKNIGTQKLVTVTGVALTGTDAVNYDLISSTISANIGGILSSLSSILTVELIGKVTKQYNGNKIAYLTADNYKLTGFVEGDNIGLISPTTGNYADRHVEDLKIVTVSGLNLSGNDAKNYTLNSTSISGNIGEITALPLTLTLTGTVTKAYDGNANAILTDLNYDSLHPVVTEDLNNVTLDKSNIVATYNDKNVGDPTPIVVTGLSLSGTEAKNYILLVSNVTNNLVGSITPKSINVSANAKNKVYGSSDPGLDYIATGLVGIDTLTGALTRDAGENVLSSPYSINQGTLTNANNPNYSITYTGANLSITPKPITITGNTKSKVYGSSDPALDYTAIDLVGSDTLSGALTRDAGENVASSPYAINQGTLTNVNNPNYSIIYTGANLSITPKPITVTGNTKSKVYGSSDPALDYTAIDLVGSDTLSGALTRDAGENVASSPYAINQGTLTNVNNPNYSIIYTGANLSITPKPITVTGNTKSKVYGSSDPALDYTAIDLVGSDTLSGALTRDAGENVVSSPYAINQGTLTNFNNPNYSITYTRANLTITTKPITYNGLIGTVIKSYDGTTNATLTDLNYDSLTGIIANDIVTLNKQYTGHYNDPNVGNKTIAVTGLTLGGSDASNYTVNSSVTGEIGNITAKELTISTNDKVTKIYDGTLDAPSAILAGLNFNIIGGVIKGDAVSISSSSSKPSSGTFDDVAVGSSRTVTITSSNSGIILDNNNYQIPPTVTVANCVINKKPMTVILTDNITKTYDGTLNASNIVSDNYAIDGIVPIDLNNTTNFNFINRPTTGIYNDLNAGTSKTVTVTLAGNNFSGNNINNYTLPTSVTGNGIINQLDLTVSLVNNSMDKVYDGNINVILSENNILPTRTYTLDKSIINGDIVKIVATTAEFNNANVLLADSVNVSGLSILSNEPGANNYTILNANSNLTANGHISTKELTVNSSGDVVKIYDGTTHANPTNFSQFVFSPDPASVCNNASNVKDDVSIKLSSSSSGGEYDSKNANAIDDLLLSGLTKKAITLNTNSNLTLTGNNKDNYHLPATLLINAGVINKSPLTAELKPNVFVTKVYDGNNTANLTSLNYNLSGTIISNEEVILNTPSNGIYDNKQAVNNKTVTVTGFTISGRDIQNYVLTNSSAAAPIGEINKKQLTAELIGEVKKKYDGNTNATLGIYNYSLKNAVVDDDVTLNNPTTGVYDDKNIATQKLVTVTGVALTGTDAVNYDLISSTISANIGEILSSLSSILTVELIGKVTKQYNGDRIAYLTADNYKLTGFVEGDNIGLISPTTGAYADRHVGDLKIVTVTGLDLTGNDAKNYTLNSTSVAGNIGEITALPVTLTLTGTVAKTYNGTTDAHFTNENYGALSLILDIDVGKVTLEPTNVTATYDNKNVGGNKTIMVNGLNLAGDSKGNYILNSNLTAANLGTITAKELTISTNDKVTKTYDGTRDAPSTILAGLNFNISGGVVAGDTVAISSSSSKPSSGTFDDATVGSNRTVTITAVNSGIILDNNNYQIPSTITVANCVINKKPITITLKDNITKNYDGTLNASNIVSDNYAIDGLVSIDFNNTDNFNFIHQPATGIYSDLNAGTSKTVTVTLASNNFTGNNINNYILPISAIGDTVGKIDPLGLSVSLINNSMDKVYDGSINVILSEKNILPAGTYTLDKSIINGDVVKIVATTADFNNPNVLLANSVNVSGLSILPTEPGANNYTILNPDNILTADGNIFSKELAVTTSGDVVKVYDGTTHFNSENLSQVVFSPDLTSVCTNASNVKDELSIELLSSSSGGEYDSKDANAIDNILLSGLAKKTVTLNTNTNLTLTGNSRDNYHLPSIVLINSGIINKIPLTAELKQDVITKSYNGNRIADLTSINYNLLGGIVNKEEVILNTRINGDYDDQYVGNGKMVTITGLTIGGKDVQNYILTNSTVSAFVGEITKKSLNASLTGTITKTYDGTTNAILTDANYSDLNGVIDKDLVILNKQYTGHYDDQHVGQFKPVMVTGVTLSGKDVNNYQLLNDTINENIGFINKAPLTITSNNQTKVYDNLTSSDPKLTYVITEGILYNDDILTGEPSRVASQNVGTYNIEQGTLTNANNLNYNIVFDSTKTFTITPKELNIIANPGSKNYGDPEPLLTYNYNGLAYGDDRSIINGALSRASGENLGDYLINQNTLTADENYIINYTSNYLTINKATLTVKGNDFEKIQGTSNPIFTINYTGFKFNDTSSLLSDVITISTTANTDSSIGTYPIIVDGPSSISNYNINYLNGQLNIVSGVTVTAPNTILEIINSSNYLNISFSQNYSSTSFNSYVSSNNAIFKMISADSTINNSNLRSNNNSDANSNTNYINFIFSPIENVFLNFNLEKKSLSIKELREQSKILQMFFERN